MKITKAKLKQIIKEEIEATLVDEGMFSTIGSAVGFKAPSGLRGAIRRMPEGKKEGPWLLSLWHVIKNLKIPGAGYTVPIDNKDVYFLPGNTYAVLGEALKKKKLVPDDWWEYINIEKLDAFLSKKLPNWQKARAEHHKDLGFGEGEQSFWKDAELDPELDRSWNPFISDARSPDEGLKAAMGVDWHFSGWPNKGRQYASWIREKIESGASHTFGKLSKVPYAKGSKWPGRVEEEEEMRKRDAAAAAGSGGEGALPYPDLSEHKKMKITKTQLKQIIQEELENLLEIQGVKTKPPAEMTAAEASIEFDSLARAVEHEKGKYPIDHKVIGKINDRIAALKAKHPGAGGTGPTGRK